MAAMAVGESIPDKITKMNEIIKSKIKGNEMRFYGCVVPINLQYLDIKLDLYVNSPQQNIITIKAFSRGHHVRKNPEHRITHLPSEEQEPASDKGDGALFLALTVLYCNNVFRDKILCWMGVLSDWWRRKGGFCTIKDACKKTERSGHSYEIDNEIFLRWATWQVKFSHEDKKSGGRKRRYKRTHKKRKKRKTRRKSKKRRRKRKKRKTKKRR